MINFDFKTTYQQLISGDIDFRRNAIGNLYIAFEKSLKRNLQFKYPFIDSEIRNKFIDEKNKKAIKESISSSPFIEEVIQIAFFKILEKNLSPKSEYAIWGWLMEIVNKTASEEVSRHWRKFEVGEDTPSDSISKLQKKFEESSEELKRLQKIQTPSDEIKSQINRLKVVMVGIIKLIQKVPDVPKSSPSAYIMNCLNEATIIFCQQYPTEAAIITEHKIRKESKDTKPNDKSLNQIAATFQMSLSNTKKIVATYGQLLKDSLSPCLD